MHQLERVFERQARQLAGRVLSHPKRTALDRSVEADVGVGLCRQERMFARQGWRD
jgi:hypothetical protein